MDRDSEDAYWKRWQIFTGFLWGPTISEPTARWRREILTANIDIVTKEDKSGIDIHIEPGTET